MTDVEQLKKEAQLFALEREQKELEKDLERARNLEQLETMSICEKVDFSSKASAVVQEVLELSRRIEADIDDDSLRIKALTAMGYSADERADRCYCRFCHFFGAAQTGPVDSFGVAPCAVAHCKRNYFLLAVLSSGHCGAFRLTGDFSRK